MILRVVAALVLLMAALAPAQKKPAAKDGPKVLMALPFGVAPGKAAKLDLRGLKLETAKESLKAAEEDLEFLRVQITTLEVATARVYNWDVMEKRRLRAEGKLVDDPGDEGDGDGDAKGGG